MPRSIIDLTFNPPRETIDLTDDVEDLPLTQPRTPEATEVPEEDVQTPITAIRTRQVPGLVMDFDHVHNDHGSNRVFDAPATPQLVRSVTPVPPAAPYVFNRHRSVSPINWRIRAPWLHSEPEDDFFENDYQLPTPFHGEPLQCQDCWCIFIYRGLSQERCPTCDYFAIFDNN